MEAAKRLEIVREVFGKGAARVPKLVRGIKRAEIKLPKPLVNPSGELAAEPREAGQQLARIGQGESVGRPARELPNAL